MDAVLHAGLLNAVTAAGLGLVAVGVTLVWRNPYVARCLWAVVLLKLLMPPLWEVPVFRYRQEVAETKPMAVQVDTSVLQSAPVRTPGNTPSPAAPSRTSTYAASASPAERTRKRAEVVRGQMAPGPSSQVASFPSLGTLWLFSAGAVAALMVLRVMQFRRLLRRAPIAPPNVEDLARRVAERLGLRRLPRLRIVDGTLPPLVWSAVGRPTVLLPARLVDRLAPQELEAVLAHEFAHVRRRDGAARWLEMAAICAYWWHPITWLARHKLQQAEEECCDADVLRIFPELRRGYAQALLNTLEFLSRGRRRLVPATGFARRNCLIRRFEMIVKKSPNSRPTHATRMLILSVALVALAVFPVVLPAESNDANHDHDSARIACTISLKDGTKIEGYIVRLADDRVVIQRKQLDGATTVPPRTVELEIDFAADAEQKEHWEIALSDCIQIAFDHADVLRQMQAKSADGRRLILAAPIGPERRLNVHAGLGNLVRDVETAYWMLWLKHREHEAAKAGRDRALELWQDVYATYKNDPKRTPAAREAQCRALLFAYRKLVTDTLSERIRAENRLRYVLGLATNDGRVIQPSENPSTDKIEFDADSVHDEALAKRTELLKARLSALDRTAQLEMARLHLGADNENPTLRHHQLLVSREEALLRDMELEVSHQVADALRDIERDFNVAETRSNLLIAAQQEFEAVRIEYELGNVLLDFLLDALRRRTDAEQNYYQAVADYTLAIARVHERKGTLLERHGIEIVTDAAAESGLENEASE